MAWAGAVVLLLLSVEGTTRLDDWAQFGVPPFEAATAIEDLSVRDSLGVHARSGSQFRQYRINALGVRGDEIPAALLAAGPVIITTGASETFGLYEERGREWPRQLQDSLARRCERPVPVLNAAFAGMALPSVRQDFRLRLQAYRPAIVVYYPTPMQYLYEALPVPAEPAHGPVAALSPWRSRAAPRLRDAVKRSIPAPVLQMLRVLDTQRIRRQSNTTVRASAPTARLDAFENELRAYIGDLKARGVTPVLVVHRNRFRDTTSLENRRMLRAWERFYPMYSGRAILTFDDSAATRTRAVAADSGVLLVDPLPALQRSSGALFFDFAHFTGDGAAVLASEIASAMFRLACDRPPRGPAASGF